MPSLKERRNDIPLLIDYFAQLLAKKFGKNYDRIAQEDIRRLVDYNWPGNVRELQNIVERAVIIHQGSTLKLSSQLIPYSSQSSIDEISSDNSVDTQLSLRNHIHESERTMILQALEKSNWKVSGPRGAANLLNIHPSTLNYRIKKFGIKKPL